VIAHRDTTSPPRTVSRPPARPTTAVIVLQSNEPTATPWRTMIVPGDKVPDPGHNRQILGCRRPPRYAGMPAPSKRCSALGYRSPAAGMYAVLGVND
jgi:hypothetical protein